MRNCDTWIQCQIAAEHQSRPINTDRNVGTTSAMSAMSVPMSIRDYNADMSQVICSEVCVVVIFYLDEHLVNSVWRFVY